MVSADILVPFRSKFEAPEDRSAADHQLSRVALALLPGLYTVLTNPADPRKNVQFSRRCSDPRSSRAYFPPSPLALGISTVMLLGAFLPASFRKTGSHSGSSKPGYLNRHISPLLQSFSRRSCTHPIHIIVFVSLLASTSYIGLLEGSLFESGDSTKDDSRGVDIPTLLDGGRSLKVGEETGWKWQSDSRGPTEDHV